MNVHCGNPCALCKNPNSNLKYRTKWYQTVKRQWHYHAMFSLHLIPFIIFRSTIFCHYSRDFPSKDELWSTTDVVWNICWKIGTVKSEITIDNNHKTFESKMKGSACIRFDWNINFICQLRINLEINRFNWNAHFVLPIDIDDCGKKIFYTGKMPKANG